MTCTPIPRSDPLDPDAAPRRRAAGGNQTRRILLPPGDLCCSTARLAGCSPWPALGDVRPLFGLRWHVCAGARGWSIWFQEEVGVCTGQHLPKLRAGDHAGRAGALGELAAVGRSASKWPKHRAWYVTMVRIKAAELNIIAPALLNTALPWLIFAGAIAAAPARRCSSSGIVGARHGHGRHKDMGPRLSALAYFRPRSLTVHV